MIADHVFLTSTPLEDLSECEESVEQAAPWTPRSEEAPISSDRIEVEQGLTGSHAVSLGDEECINLI
ncbi:MAG: hypothetical protein J07HQX50_01037 [Haloquadratum sp. J07HQX50]|jgi:hypothetical protein|nr:MAG: hypothetical protein J07HQX50_01037 [Haloquadratum sp. J07HQX50]